MPDLELGNIAFNTNKNQKYNCPRYLQALLNEIDNILCKVMWNIEQKEYESPFKNTANTFKNKVFEVQAYSWNDDIQQQYNFKYKDIEISWYKYLGRDTTINKEIKPEEAIKMFDDCIESLIKLEKEKLDEIIPKVNKENE